MKCRIMILLALCLFLGVLSGCGTAETDDGKLSVVAVTFPPYDFARAIAGDNAHVTMLMDPGTETHTYDPTPGDIRVIRSCDIFIYGGGESDAWMDEILASVDTSRMTILSMTELVELYEEGSADGMTLEHAHENCEDPAHDHESEHSAYDKHVWTSPANAAVITEAICRALCAADEENEALYRANADAYINEIRALSADFAAVVQSAPRKTLVFADRFPFLYFVREFGLSYFAAFPGCAEQTEPGAQSVATMISKVKAEKIPVVFYTEFSNQQLADSVCEATGAVKMRFHSCHNVSKTDFDAGVTYVSLMRENLENLKGALIG